METQASNKISNPLMWAAGIAIILFCGAGIGAIMGWIPTSIGQPAEAPAPVVIGKTQSGAPALVAPKSSTYVPTPAPAPQVLASNEPPAHRRCAECGVVESTRQVATKGTGTGIGAVGGAVVGGLLGHQIGSGRGNQVATAVGAVGGVVAGNEIEKRVRTTHGYEVVVRLYNGSSRVIGEGSAPTWHTGDHVKIVDGAIRAN